MRILVFHQYYLMPGQGGGSRFNEMTRLWTEAGHEVAVIAGTVEYTTGVKPERYRRRWLLKEDDNGVVVWRCYVPEAYGASYAGRMRAFFAFVFSAATATLHAARPDVIIATSPPLIIALPAIFAARLRWRQVPWVFEVRDLWPESAVTTGVLSRKSPLTRLLYTVERWAYRSADRINVLTPAFEQDIVRRGLAPASKISLIPNGADLDNFAPGPMQNDVRKEFGWGERFVLLYAGAHGRANAVGQLVAAAALLRDRPDILIATVGDGNERAAAEYDARASNLNNIVFLGSQPKERMASFVNAANAGAAVLQDNPTFRTVYPNKVFDYMACARPTLLAIDGVARALVCDEAQAGLFVKPENAPSIAEGIRTLADNPALCGEMGARGRAWVEANASRRALAHRYLDVLSHLNSVGGKRVSAHSHA
jgi:glycosyltransferase involved in cell wall biosynthesis